MEDASRRLEVFIRAAPTAVKLDDREIPLNTVTDLLEEPRTGPGVAVDDLVGVAGGDSVVRGLHPALRDRRHQRRRVVVLVDHDQSGGRRPADRRGL